MQKVLDTLASLGLSVQNTMIDMGDEAVEARYITSGSRSTLRFDRKGIPTADTQAKVKALMEAAVADGAKGSFATKTLICFTRD